MQTCQTPSTSLNIFHSKTVVISIIVRNAKTHFMLMVSFHTPWKHQKTFGFLIFLGGMEIDRWQEMSYGKIKFYYSKIQRVMLLWAFVDSFQIF